VTFQNSNIPKVNTMEQNILAPHQDLFKTLGKHDYISKQDQEKWIKSVQHKIQVIQTSQLIDPKILGSS
jgi:hypothetical protein